MTPQQAKELLPIITAYANGEEIQCRDRFNNSVWMSNTNFGFNPRCYEYRIKPKETVLYSRVFKGLYNPFIFGRPTIVKDITDINTIYPLMGHTKITLLENKIVSTVFEPLEKYHE